MKPCMERVDRLLSHTESEENGCVYIYKRITLLYSRSDCNIENQLSSNKTLKMKKKTQIKRRVESTILAYSKHSVNVTMLGIANVVIVINL